MPKLCKFIPKWSQYHIMTKSSQHHLKIVRRPHRSALSAFVMPQSLHLSVLPREYNTLHVESCPPTMDSSTTCEPSLGATLVCFSVGIQHLHVESCPPTMDSSTTCRPSLGATLVCFTEGTQHFACRILPTEKKIKRQLRTQSGRSPSGPTVLLTAGILHFGCRISPS